MIDSKVVIQRAWQLLIWRFEQIPPVWRLVLACVSGICVVILIKNRQRDNFRKMMYRSILSVYLLFLLIVTVFSRGTIPENYQLVSFDISTAWTIGPGIYGKIDTFAELTMNILMFVPLGFFLARLAEGKAWAVAAGCILITLGLETLQLLMKRGFFELADIMLNFAGGAIGSLIDRLLRTFRGKTI